tara:strand:- start:383 stop:706 length:324 start_codon:yes stop_codon:yes gene_type:complete
MSWYVKTERFNKKALKSPKSYRREVIKEHKRWVESIKNNGREIYSGYLINENQLPGGGGLLLIKAISFEDAKTIILKDPMITNDLVDWELNEWVQLGEDISSRIKFT